MLPFACAMLARLTDPKSLCARSALDGGRNLQRDRLDSIQALRGIAAALIVLQHTMHMTNDQAGVGSSLFVGLFRNTGFAGGGVDLFFVISGFVMSASLDDTTGQHP